MLRWFIWAGGAIAFLVLRIALVPALGLDPTAGRTAIIVRLGEMWWLGGLLLWLSERRELVKVLGCIGGAKSLVLGILVGAVIVAQYAPGQGSYPFVQWSMYSAPADAATFRSYVLVTDAGREHLPFADAAPTTSPRAVMLRLNQKVARAVDGDSLAARQAAETLVELVRLSGVEAVEQVEVLRCVAEMSVDEPVNCEREFVVRADGSGYEIHAAP